MRFIELFFLCTFLSTVTEKYQKNTAKGLGALWTPVFPIWVCLTEEIHGHVSKRISAVLRRYVSPRAQTQPKVGASHAFIELRILPRGGGSVLPFVSGKAAAAPASTGKKQRQTARRNKPLSHRAGQPTARTALRRLCGSMANCDLTARLPFRHKRNGAQIRGKDP